MTRLPPRREAFLVFSVLVFCIYSWTLYRFFYQLPSWLNYTNLNGLLFISAYVLSFALIESLAMLGFILLLSVILPLRLFRQRFVTQGSTVALALSLGAVLLQRQVSILYDLELWQLIAAPLLVLAGLAALILLAPLLYDRLTFRQKPLLPRLLNELAERMTIFAYLYVPISLLGLLVVLFRNLF